MVRGKLKLGQKLLVLFLALAVLSTGIASVVMLNTVAADEKEDLRQPLNLPDGSRVVPEPPSVLAATWDAGDPGDDEQYMLELVNWARLNPTDAAFEYGIDLNEGLPAQTISPDPKQPLAMNAKLLDAAWFHIHDMFTNQFFAHTGSAGDSPWDRITDAGYNYSLAGENIAWKGSTGTLDGTQTVFDLERNLFVDEGITGRGHRRNILNPNFREIGIGIGSGTFQGYNAYVVTQDFGSDQDNRPFVLGVVYQDQDGDDFYTPGEGIGGVNISSGGGSLQTTTSASGGYAIKVATPGTYTLTAFGSGINLSKGFTINDKNVKVDFIKGEDGVWDPWAYDENPKDGIIQKMEAIHAIQDYFSGKISKMQAIQVVMLYFG